MGAQGTLYSDADYAEYADGGFIAWAPVRDRGSLNLHLVGKAPNGQLVELDGLLLRSRDTRLTGGLVLDKRLTVVDGGVTVQAGGLRVVGDSEVDGALRSTERLTVGSGGLFVVAGGADVTGASTIRDGGLDAAGPATLLSGLTVGTATGLGGTLAIGRNASHASSLSVTGKSTLGGGVHGQLAITGGGLIVHGLATFQGPVSFNKGISVTGQPGPIPSVSGAAGGPQQPYINRDGTGAGTGAYDLVSLRAKQGSH